QLVKWWGPASMHVVDHDIDVRVGGPWRTTIRNRDGDDYTMSGVYREISAPHRLVFTWAWEQDGVRGHETVVTIDLAEDGDRTELNFVQEIFESEDMRDSHQGGWQSSFDCLAAAITKGEIR
ncbi:MAG: SRPBCC family protein, partial [Geminicoccaceae bacterium]